MLTQLQIPLPLETPKGKAWAVVIIDYGPHWDLLWVTFLHDSGECWTFTNSDIRQEKNYTFGIIGQSPIPNFHNGIHYNGNGQAYKNTPPIASS